jgi:hypothetical protein
MLFHLVRPKVLEIEGPFQDDLTDYFYAQVYFSSEKECVKWAKRLERESFPVSPIVRLYNWFRGD